MANPITVATVVNKDMKTVWDAWTNPAHITKWAFAEQTWEAPHAENDVREGGRFLTRMQAKDGSAGFDFTGTYTRAEEGKLIEYTMDGDDARKVSITFTETPEGVRIVETFDPENENPEEMQRAGWQAFLDNFKKHAESLQV